MKILDRFLAREFAKYFFYSTAVLVFLYIVIDLFEDLGKFIEKNVAVFSLIKYYVLLTPSYTILLMPVGALLATFLVFGFMTRHREVIALKSSGLTIWRLFTPLCIIGLSLVALSFVLNETVTVWANGKWDEVRQIEIDKRPRPDRRARRNFFYSGENSRIFYIRQLNAAEGKIHDFTIWELAANLKIKRRIDGRVGSWNQSGWTFFNVTTREFYSDTIEIIKQYDSLKVVDITERPKDFLRVVKPLEQSTFLELLTFIKKKTRAGEDVSKEKVELNYRFSFPFINLILLLLGFPLSLQLRKGGVAFGIGLGLIFAFTYWGLIQTFKAYAVAGIVEPFLSAWIPNLIFLSVGLVLLATTKK